MISCSENIYKIKEKNFPPVRLEKAGYFLQCSSSFEKNLFLWISGKKTGWDTSLRTSSRIFLFLSKIHSVAKAAAQNMIFIKHF